MCVCVVFQVTRKLAGHAAGTAAWATNVGNEMGQVLISVLTASEGSRLSDMATGLVRRYEKAGVDPPVVLYVDRDCCSSATKRLFQSWCNLQIRLDVWHFMRRLGSCCTTESHPLYVVFMSRLSACIFEWDRDDVALLRQAKAGVLAKMDVTGMTDDYLNHQLTNKELSLHCRRRTQGVHATIRMIGNLIACLDSDEGRDTLGVPLFDHDRIRCMWQQQQKHVACIQDPPGISLYTRTGFIH